MDFLDDKVPRDIKNIIVSYLPKPCCQLKQHKKHMRQYLGVYKDLDLRINNDKEFIQHRFKELNKKDFVPADEYRKFQFLNTVDLKSHYKSIFNTKINVGYYRNEIDKLKVEMYNIKEPILECTCPRDVKPYYLKRIHLEIETLSYDVVFKDFLNRNPQLYNNVPFADEGPGKRMRLVKKRVLAGRCLYGTLLCPIVGVINVFRCLFCCNFDCDFTRDEL